jgi:sugar phosphate isomerase/epimerase
LVVVTSLADWNADVRRFTLRWLKQQLDISYDFDSNTTIIVPGEYVWEGKEIKPEVQYQWAVEALREVGDHAKGLGIDIAIESNTPTHNMVRTIADLARIIEDTDHPSVKANVDVVNMYALGDRPRTLERLKGKIANVHFSDTPRGMYLHYPPGRGVVPLRKDLMSLRSGI